MAALGDVSSDFKSNEVESSLQQAVPTWPDVSVAFPSPEAPSTGGGFAGHFSFG